MNLNAHFLLLRPGRFSFGVGVWSFAFILFTFSIWGPPAIYPAALLFWGIGFPAIFGLTLASMLNEVLHRPFSLLLPNAARQLLIAHVLVVCLLALLFSVLGWVFNHHLPFFPLFSLAVAMGTLWLPFEPGFRWAGSRKFASAAVATLAVTVWKSGFLKENFFAQPTAFGAIALGIATMNFAVSFSAAARRRRAMTPFTSALSAFFDEDVMTLLNKDARWSKSAVKARWRDSLVNASTAKWVKAVCFERRGRRIFETIAGCVMVMAFYSWFSNRRFPDTDLASAAYRTIFGSKPNNSGYFSFVLCLLVFSQPTWTLRAGSLYPLSRQRSAFIAFAALGWQSLLHFVSLLSGVLLLAIIGAHWTGQAFIWLVIGRWTLLLMAALPVMALIQWCMIHVEIRRNRTGRLLAVMLAFAVLSILSEFSKFFLNPTGLTTILAATVLSQYALWAALKRFYLKGDLLQTGTTNRSFSLV